MHPVAVCAASMGHHYHVFRLAADLVIEAESASPAVALDWWLAHEAGEAVQLVATYGPSGQCIRRAVVLKPAAHGVTVQDPFTGANQQGDPPAS